MSGGSTIGYDGIVGIANVVLSLLVLIMLLYYLKFRSSMDELSRRLLLAGFFLGIHELTFFLGNSFVYELTKTLFFITLFYSLMFIVKHNIVLKEKLEENEMSNMELKRRLEEIKKEIT